MVSSLPEEAMPSRLMEFSIEGLFGLYDHQISLNLKDRITIIIGPNGRGKTVCLKFIEALFRNRLTYFSDILFRTASFTFTGGEVIGIHRLEKSGGGALSFSLRIRGQDEVTWTPPILDPRAAREMRRYIPPSWEQMGPDLWIDETDGEELTLRDLAARYNLPPKLLASFNYEIPNEFKRLVGDLDCHLIETQRLLVLQPGSDGNEFGEYPPRRRARDTGLAIQQKAQTLRTILKDTLTKYANLSQSLDRTFPLRVFEAQGTATLTQDELRQELSRLDERREALMGAGIIDTEYQPVTMRPGNIESGVAMALEIYVRDTSQKLDVFNNLRSRLDLFKELIDKRFIDKSIHIDRELGFRITSRTNIEVPLEKLSSGEQHQLILVFDLLFEVTPNSLILIDEPELSLHVAWQKSFIESLKRIIELNAFDVLLATHSPAVVAKHFSLTVELGPVDE
ncbi:AAA family ATPase [Bradyrhizobium sp. 21]|uniref:AAA family ATPase n=1 Tax=Bradyrhizobium sp. 21 TaxID=2782666 RepID=UPI001FF8ADB0|nr:AAA family ATPase [Bradyrhizobium sp. 21]MCK1386879.1 AAA family ATPase [Bradyrhizobium sp. 21]